MANTAEKPSDQSLLDMMRANLPDDVDKEQYRLSVMTLMPAGGYGPPGTATARESYPREQTDSDLDRQLILIHGLSPSPEARRALLFETFEATEADRAAVPAQHRPNTRDGWIAFWARREREGVTRRAELSADRLLEPHDEERSEREQAARERIEQAYLRALTRLTHRRRRAVETYHQLLLDGFKGLGRHARAGEMMRRLQMTQGQWKACKTALARLYEEELQNLKD